MTPKTAGLTGQLPLTGERTRARDRGGELLVCRHEAAYVALAPYCAGAVVVEAGCG